MSKEKEIGVLSELIAMVLIETKSSDRVLLTLADKLLRRTQQDVSRIWMPWAFYITEVVFDGNTADYEQWAKENTRSFGK